MTQTSKKTKIVATIGPATDSPETLEQLVMAGMNMARFNTKHSEPEWHNERLARVREVAAKLQAPIATLLDLQGPEIRINVADGGGFTVQKDETVIFTSNQANTEPSIAYVPQTVIDSLSIDDLVLLEDGDSEFIVVKKGADFLEAKALLTCKVNHRKTMNTPGVVLDMPSLTERDYQYLDGVNPAYVDYVGLSFVRDASDIAILKAELEKRGFKAGIIAKIENQEAINNLDEIIAHSDAVMVARGDLGVEVPYQELIYWQKIIIDKCRMAGLPVITATQMLKSMVDSPRPTRAEVSDVANAIYDGTDAVMLSEETTIGNYPVKAVATQAKIAEYNEQFVALENPELPGEDTDLTALISDAVIGMIEKTQSFDKIVCFTETGLTARMFARFRTNVPVYAVTSSEAAQRKMALLYGVTPFVVTLEAANLEAETPIIAILKEQGVVQSGERIIFVHGTVWQDAGMTNSITVHTIE